MPTPTILRLLTTAIAVCVASVASPAASEPAKPEAAGGAPAFAIDDVLVAPSPSGPSLNSVLVRIELLSPEARASLNGQSASITLDDDCDGHQVRLRRVLVFRGARQAGTPSEASAPASWLPFSSHSYAAQIAEAICARRGELVAAAAPAPDAAAGTPAHSRPVTPSPASPSPMAASSAPAPPVGSPIQLAETSPLPPEAPPATAYAPAATPAPASPPAASQARVSAAGVSAAAPPVASASASLSSAAPAGGIQVQYLSTTSEAELERARDKLREQLGADAGRLSFSTAHAVVRGVSRFRGRIGPFASASEATAFCAMVKRSGFACLPVPDGGGR